MYSTQKLQKCLTLDKRLLGTIVGGGAIAVLGLFGVTHPAPSSVTRSVTADSGEETKFPPYSSPAVAAMHMGATTTTQPTDEPTVLATTKAVPAIKAGS
ncbi:hypothetical protein ORI20_16970 [Mycobacterium sp. CVI_P3]|uniref:Uncharacterized protein n=1 Tax=Mycobacterium pinniadriaticum TaxID=2994102 RepID=A0ABT3SFV9_9MYCO|nr:hypothetical protein [Mycobacterium pinniadriaticum]MCX2931977.1 hypothetical protein [Mycobacterium pinniadriaticum]MCX2938401.1 hypothetical protein [Mycobacterium pinniadriaticum]